LAPQISTVNMRRTIRISILALGALAAVLALRAQSVQQLWFLTSDLVFVLLFPQLVYALFDPLANRTGSMVAFAASLVIRLGAGEPILGISALLPYAQIFAGVLPGSTEVWLDPTGRATLFPVRTLAAVVGLVLLPLVSRMTARWDPARPLPLPREDTAC